MENSTCTSNQIYGMSREVKYCGHDCYPSNLKKCCSCEDLRPLAEGYEMYVDGLGYTTTAARDDGYCPVCNTKNYEKWMERVRKETKKKQGEDDERQRLEDERRKVAEVDRLKHTDKASGRVEYTNGHVYVGGLLNGQPQGQGRMDYADNENDILSYEGQWANGKHEGLGKKVWMDDLWYQGEWKNGTMHGQGVCHVNEVDIMEGRFEEDVFQD